MSKAPLPPQSFETVRLSDVTPHPENPRKGQVPNIAASIQANGFFGALVVQRSTGHILVGNHRHAAAREAGLTELPALFLDVDDDRARRILLADNRSAELATWDQDALIAMLNVLSVSDDSLAGTAFTDDDLADLHALLKPRSLDDLADEYGEPSHDSLWPTFRVRLPPQVFTRLNTYLAKFDGDNDAERVITLLDEAGA